MKLLKSPRGWKKCYDKIIIVSPTFLLQSELWSQISPEGVSVHLAFTPEIIIDLMRQQTEDKSRRILMILDDLGEDVLRSKEATPVFHKLIANSRHLNISLIWLCQKLTQSPTFCRANCDVFVSFASLSTRERDALYNEVSMVDKRSFSAMFTLATEEQYSTFSATFRDGKLTYWKNLEIPIE